VTREDRRREKMGFDPDNPLVQRVASEIDVESLAADAGDRFREAADGGVSFEEMVTEIREFVADRNLATNMGRLKLGDVVKTAKASAAETADVGFPGSLPLVIAIEFMASRGARTALVKTPDGPVIVDYDQLRQIGDGLRSLFQQVSDQALEKAFQSISPWKGISGLGAGAWSRAVNRLGTRLLYFRCQNDPSHCFPSGEEEEWCVFGDGAVSRVSGC
jgi:hypothetical protein